MTMDAPPSSRLGESSELCPDRIEKANDEPRGEHNEIHEEADND